MYLTDFRNVSVSMFQKGMEQTMTDDQSSQKDPQISLFDVKELYDRAYALKDKAYDTSAYDFKDALTQAVKLDMAYRQQIAQQSEDRFSPALEKHREAKVRAA